MIPSKVTCHRVFRGLFEVVSVQDSSCQSNIKSRFRSYLRREGRRPSLAEPPSVGGLAALHFSSSEAVKILNPLE